MLTRYNCNRIQGYNGDTSAKPREIQPDTTATGYNCNRIHCNRIQLQHGGFLLQPDTMQPDTIKVF